MPSGIYKRTKKHSEVLKESHKRKSYGFLKGHPQFNTGRTHWKEGEHVSPKTEFKKGSKINPWMNKKLWKGTQQEYLELHRWVRKKKGKPKICKYCGTKNKLVWANKSQKYKKDVNDYISLCRSCHTKNDLKIIKLKL